MFVNVAAYKFTPLSYLKRHKRELLRICQQQSLKGSILLSPEGINLFVAGTRVGVDALLDSIRAKPGLEDLETKESESLEQPYHRMLVKIKKEIIAFGVEGVHPEKRTSTKLRALELKQWLDEGRDFLLLDVRNEYEIRLGTFSGANSLKIDNFREFPDAVGMLPEESKKRPLVMFCTGGIRCEKAGPLMEQRGFEQVYQLDGGILKYFEECGGNHYDGECFVFDQRVAVDGQLRETEAAQCFACLAPLTSDDQQSETYVAGKSCPHCYQSVDESMATTLRDREDKIRKATNPLPGSIPYINKRPIHIPSESDGLTLLEYLTRTYVFVPPEAWQDRFDRQLLLLDERPVLATHVVKAGDRIEHWFPDTIEPDVNPNIRLIYEDEALIVVNKPAPLPMHPCGRFNRNTLTSILANIYKPQRLRLAHRLDANTSGVVVFSRTRQVAARLQPQFAAGRVAKRYLCLVNGNPPDDEFSCDEAISARSFRAGARTVDRSGLASTTHFIVRERRSGKRAVLEARPITGRTNQIRIHLWHLGWPIEGDPMYRPNHQIQPKQTVSVSDSPLCLHAHSVEFDHPLTGDRVQFQAPEPTWA